MCTSEKNYVGEYLFSIKKSSLALIEFYSNFGNFKLRWWRWILLPCEYADNFFYLHLK